MHTKNFAAVDLGASNGRTILGCFDGSRLRLEELNRFENNYVRTGDSYYWDVLFLYNSILKGLKQFSKGGRGQLDGIGIDTWGVDFGLIDKRGRLVGNPYSYRDRRALRGQKAFFDKYGERAAFDINGIANLEFNTIYQLYDMVSTDDPQLTIADKLLLIPDLLSYMLCGKVSCEYTNATTTQMLGVDRKWSSEIIKMMGIRETLLPQIQMSGEVKGRILKNVADETCLSTDVPVYCVGSHDTASAIASVPVSKDSYAFLSSGTWSLIGMENENPIINDIVFKNRFSNEGTITGGVRLLRNIMGLWIIQNCKREWDSVQKVSWDEIVNAAKQAPAFRSLIDVNAHVFFDGINMIAKIQQYCADTNQPVPQTMGQVARTVYESLAMCYKEAFVGLEELKGETIDVLHIVGGGSNNKLLNQLTANSINRTVVAGPAEATAIGNLMVQVKASGEVKNLAEMRQVVRYSFDVEMYRPQQTNDWLEFYNKYKKIKSLYKRKVK